MVADFAWQCRRHSANGSGCMKTGHGRSIGKPDLLIETEHKTFDERDGHESFAVGCDFDTETLSGHGIMDSVQ